MNQVRIHYMDMLAAFRIAAEQARRDGMPMCAKRHEDDAAALEFAYGLKDEAGPIEVVFW